MLDLLLENPTFNSTDLSIVFPVCTQEGILQFMLPALENVSSCIHTENITMLVSARMVNNPHKPAPGSGITPMHYLCILECEAYQDMNVIMTWAST